MREQKPFQHPYQTKQEPQGRQPEHGDLFVYYMEQRRRSLITELRSLEELLGKPQSIPPRTR